jgi:hypothetical protein
MVQTLYAELLQQLVNAEARRATSGQRGSFVSKEICGRRYWYLQYRELGQQRQKYIGPESPEVRAFMDEARESWHDEREAQAQRSRLCAMLAAGGAYTLGGIEARLLRLLAQAGVFRVGGVLAGSLAFATYSNMLGIRFAESATRTQDLDIAQDNRVAVVLSQDQARVDLQQVLAQPHEGLKFQPIPALNPKHPSTSFRILNSALHVTVQGPC